jgi:hypothetical protein
MSNYDKKIFDLLGPEPTDVGEWMSVTNPADLVRAQRCIAAMLTDRPLRRVAEAGDDLSKEQTKHDIDHWLGVYGVGMSILPEYDKLFPGRIDEWTRRVVLPAGLFLHDAGRAIDVDQHAPAGARLAWIYFNRLRFPPEVIRRICRIIALHRSGSVLKREFDDFAWAMTVVADKCVGDEDRVRPLQANMLRVLSLLGLAHINWWEDASHDRVNFAIKKADLIVDCDEDSSDKTAGALVLKVSLRERVAPPEEVITLYAERWHACGRAAQYLGFVFRLEFNGVGYMYDKATKGWSPVRQISVPCPNAD